MLKVFVTGENPHFSLKTVESRVRTPCRTGSVLVLSGASIVNFPTRTATLRVSTGLSLETRDLLHTDN